MSLAVKRWTRGLGGSVGGEPLRPHLLAAAARAGGPAAPAAPAAHRPLSAGIHACRATQLGHYSTGAGDIDTNGPHEMLVEQLV